MQRQQVHVLMTEILFAPFSLPSNSTFLFFPQAAASLEPLHRHLKQTMLCCSSATATIDKVRRKMKCFLIAPSTQGRFENRNTKAVMLWISALGFWSAGSEDWMGELCAVGRPLQPSPLQRGSLLLLLPLLSPAPLNSLWGPAALMAWGSVRTSAAQLWLAGTGLPGA